MKSESADSAIRRDLESFEAVLGHFTPAVGKIALRARKLVLDVYPGAYEIVWTVQKNTGYGTGPKKQTEHFCWISPASKHVTLGFNYGVELPDPEKLLLGTGKLFRHVRLASIADVERPAVRALLVAASKHRVPQHR